MELVPGLTNKCETIVSEPNIAKTMKSGTHEVFATPALVALIEEATVECVKGALEPGQATVGVEMEVKHIAPTPVGMIVCATCVLDDVSGHMLTFSCEVHDEIELAATAIHKRFIVDDKRFQLRANSKNN